MVSAGASKSSESSLEKRLTIIMQTWSMPINHDCEQFLTKLIHDAALRVKAEGFDTNPEKLFEAEENFRKLLSEMTRQAGILGLRELHEPTFFKALKDLCPIWPFCYTKQ